MPKTEQKPDLARLAWMRSGDREGDGAVFTGHRHTPETVTRLAEPVIGPGPYEVHEVHMHYTPRVKWCERIDGFGCESNGQWHGHWSQTRQNPHHPDAAAITVVFRAEEADRG